ncbi:nitrous oxide reductase accessory protein NosL [Vibrio sp. J383]|uniref:nitrous oxide reductase accessory protein NosL n=1 Tax=Vibrio sp. J383 TaxID=2942997 RepID=UPI0020BF4648|nr:nitrous oxide reductase accessory protein NosL [Vibrio sp. J383]UQV21736.1 nitrous oxide reductase accessory protein NosL [Vibrio sp. J383]|tara:strand:+ start:333 stop:827 length:495 start_codon:yes stop_codon:yes gene_type:complete
MRIPVSSSWIGLVLSSVFLFGCNEAPQEKMLKQAVAIENADECHLCGMIIANFPGPKGEAYQKGNEEIMKFCSTRDLFSYVLQPENERQIQQIFVHDMSKTPWQKPENEYFIDAKAAWFVIGSSKTGAMGSTLGSFSTQDDAIAFSEKFGGKVYQFDDIRIDLL